jgi:hypothetical protein
VPPFAVEFVGPITRSLNFRDRLGQLRNRFAVGVGLADDDLVGSTPDA